MMNNVKLGVEVISAHDLKPKDGQGSSNAFVELRFDGQRFRTTTKERDLNPVWNETFYFNITDPNNLADQTLEAIVYSYDKGSQSGTFLGKVRIHGTAFVHYSDASEWHYPLEKRRVFDRVKGELGLKVFLTDDPGIRLSNPIPEMDTSGFLDQEFDDDDHMQQTRHDNSAPVPMNDQGGNRRTYRHLPNPDSLPASNIISNAMNQRTSMQQNQYFANAPRPEQQPPRFFGMNAPGMNVPGMNLPGVMNQAVDYAIRETSPMLGGGRVVGGRVIRSQQPVSTYDLVEKMQFLFVRVVRARDLPNMDIGGGLDPYVVVKVGNYKGTTKYFNKDKNPEWNEVFAFSKDRLQSHILEVQVHDKDLVKDDFVGLVRFDLSEIPTRVPPDSPLAPQWYRLEDRKGDKTKNGEVMLAVWYGTQADEAFPDAWHSDTIAGPEISPSNSSLVRSKVFHSPRLWYLRVNVIEAHDLVPSERARLPDVYVKAQLGNHTARTKPAQARPNNAFWNEDLMLVAAEPFDDHLVLTVEDRVGPNKEETLGKVIIPLASVPKRLDDRPFPGKWYNLQRPSSTDIAEENKKERERFASKLHLRISLDGGYHVFDESTYYSCDLRPSARQLWKPSIGVLELGILSADKLQPMKTRDGKGTADTFCVARYGHKWIRTRTIIDSLSPKYNEQYTWEVYDPATVLTIGVFDNGHLGSNVDSKIGKVRIRISTLEAGRVYTHCYPLLVLHPSGVKKMGELHLAVRFSCTSMVNLMSLYTKPLLPKMHYARPLNIFQTNILRQQAISIVTARLSRADPPLRKEVVEYMCDADAHFWSMRRSKANFYRICSVLQSFLAVGKWFGEVSLWKNPITTVLVHLLFVMLVCFPELILPTAFLYMFLIGIWNYRFREKHPPHMDTRISYAENVHPDELDEEFDTFPTSKGADIVRWRYDRLRSVAAQVQKVMGDIAAQGERIQLLLSWRDPRATSVFLSICLVSAVVLYVTPLPLLAALVAFYQMRHPKFRAKLPAAPVNFFKRLPAKTDYML
ncbi:Multiple C2 domain and transmembrane region protein 7-like protein [Drosera capensis]